MPSRALLAAAATEPHATQATIAAISPIGIRIAALTSSTPATARRTSTASSNQSPRVRSSLAFGLLDTVTLRSERRALRAIRSKFASALEISRRASAIWIVSASASASVVALPSAFSSSWRRALASWT